MTPTAAAWATFCNDAGVSMPRSRAGPRCFCVAICRWSEARWQAKLFRSSVLKSLTFCSPVHLFSVALRAAQRMGDCDVIRGRRRVRVEKNIGQTGLTLAPYQVNTVIRNPQSLLQRAPINRVE